MPSSIIERTFNEISLEKNQSLWLSSKDSFLLNDRLKLIASFPQCLNFNQYDEEEPRLAPKNKSYCSVLLNLKGRKNSHISDTLRIQGNQAYGLRNYKDALKLYNDSLRSAETDAQMALIYANRSAVWADLGYHQHAATDAHRAIKGPYPSELKYKVHERLGTALKIVGNRDQEAQAAFLSALEALKISNLQGIKLIAKETHIRKLIQNVNIEHELKTCPDENVPSFSSNNLLKEKNSMFPSLSSCLEIRCMSGKGRHCIATRDIKCGEILAFEEPFVYVLDEKEVLFRCWYCLKYLNESAMIPCINCSDVIFCDEKCRKNAFDAGGHEYECGIVFRLYEANIGSWFLAYKALISRSLEFYMEKRQYFANIQSTSIGSDLSNQSQIYIPPDQWKLRDVQSFHLLASLDDCGKKRAPELMMQSVVTIFLLRCLRDQNYYQSKEENKKNNMFELSDTEMFLARLLHHFMRITFYNAHEIGTVVAVNDSNHLSRYTTNHTRRIGAANYLNLSLFNHSCHPNYRRITVDEKNALGIAIRPITKGEEVTDTYTGSFAACTLEQRCNALKKYNFICKCLACTEKWPTFEEGLPTHLTKESQFKIPADKIQIQTKRVSTVKKLKEKICNDEKSESEDILKILIRYNEELRGLLVDPHKDLVIAEDELYRCMTTIYAIKAAARAF